jgi:hypothetical protein
MIIALPREQEGIISKTNGKKRLSLSGDERGKV